MLVRRILLLLLGMVGLGLLPSSLPTQAATVASHPRVGARVNDMTWQQATNEIGAMRVTRLFYGQLPTTFSREGIPDGVLIIVSYKEQNTNVASYVRSIPIDQRVQLVYHHEPEADYASGSTFVSEFNAQQKLAEAANPSIPFGFIAVNWAYRDPTHDGYAGDYIPPNADRYYLDSYQRGNDWSPIRPAAEDPVVQRFMSLVTARGHRFNGFTEYGRGAVDADHPLTDAMIQQRVSVFAADNVYLRSLPGIRVWAYWYTTDLRSGRQWRLTDTKSQQAWRAVTSTS